MPRGVRQTGLTRERILPPDRAREMREKLQEQLSQLEAQDTQRYALIGRAVSEHAAADPTYAQELQRILGERIRDRGERVRLGLTTERRGRRKAAGDTSATTPTSVAQELP